MTRTYLELKDNKWYEVEKSDFWIDTALYRKLVGLKMIQAKGWDGVIIVDGKERSGKSVLGMVMGWYLSNGHLTLNNFARGLNDASEKISTLPDRSVIIVDEASLVYSSKDSMTDAGKKLMKIMDVVGQKNLIFILCLPCFFDLNKTMAVRRSLFLCHVYPDDKYNRGQYALWGEKSKKMLYIFGKKNYDSYNFPKPELVGEYLDFEPPFYQEYKDIVKKESLREVLKNAEPKGKGRSAEDVESSIYGVLKYKMKWTIPQLMTIKGQPENTILDRLNRYKLFNGLIEPPVPLATTN